MSIDGFINLINNRLGMRLTLDDLDKDLTSFESWDSLVFIYLVVELEKEEGVKINVEHLLDCYTLRQIYGSMKHEILADK